MFVIIILEAKQLYFLVFHNVKIVATYGFDIIEGYLEGNAKIKISINFDFHIPRPLTTIANRKCGPENQNVVGDLNRTPQGRIQDFWKGCSLYV